MAGESSAEELDMAPLAISLGHYPQVFGQELDLLQTHVAGVCFLSFIGLS